MKTKYNFAIELWQNNIFVDFDNGHARSDQVTFVLTVNSMEFHDGA